jgi:imidazolonepropionase-like amidohydrolase
MSPVLAIAAQALDPASAGLVVQTETATIGGQIIMPPNGQPALELMLENVVTDVVVVVPLEPGQPSYSAVVPAGCYCVYAWLPSFDLMGGYTACEGDRPCSDHTLRNICVEGGESVDDVDVADWHLPETPLLALGGRMIDGTGTDPIEDGVVVVWDRHIMAVGQSPELAVPSAARHLDLPGTTILPGFINAHVHNSYRPDILQAWAAAGVTTVRDVGAPVSLRWDDLRGLLETETRNARILSAGPLVTCPGGYPIAGNNFPSLTVDSVEEVQLEINSLIDRGADVIKLVIESGIGELLSVELATAVVDTAHARGIPVTVHVNLERDLASALDAGVDDIAHIVLDYVPDIVIQRMVDADVGWVPTFAAFGGNGTQMYDNLRRFVAAGGRVALGNDGGYISGLTIGMPMTEIELMEFAGMTPMQIIVAATSDAAVVCRRQDLLGTLATGKLADILVVEGDPLIDLRALQDVRLVVHEGTIIRHEEPAPRRAGGRLQPP